MNTANKVFEEAVLPHLDAAYNLARWIVKDEHAAEDAVQDAYLRAFRYFGSFRGGDARPWLMRIVRNSCYSWLQSMKHTKDEFEFNDELEHDIAPYASAGTVDNPEALLVRNAERSVINAAIESLPVSFREVLILREIEEMPYQGIAEALQVPVGTVMSRLARARARLRVILEDTFRPEALEAGSR